MKLRGENLGAVLGKNFDVEKFKEYSRQYEKGRIGYTMNRGLENSERDWLHGVNLEAAIEAIIEENKKSGCTDKVKILDIGGGSGFLAHQIKKKFGDAVETYTTGLRKLTAKKERRKLADSVSEDIAGLHQNDLKWRSIFELSDFPEFDLIHATYAGEFDSLENEEELEMFLEAVIRKLKSGRFATIAAVFYHNETNLPNVMKKLETKYPDVTIEFAGRAGVRIIKK